MASLGTLVATGDSAVGSWLTDAGGTTNLWQKIEETVAGATDTNDFIKANNDVNNSDYKASLGDTPANFASMLTALFNVRYRQQGRAASNPDTYGLQIRIVNGATILAAADSGGTFQSVAANITTTTFTNTGAVAFTYVNTTASKTTWDGAVVEIRQTYTQTGSKDGGHVEVSAFEITGTYVVALSVTGGVTPAGSAVKAASKPLSGAGTPAGALAKQARFNKGGGLTPSGAWSYTRSVAMSLAGAITPAAVLAKAAAKATSGGATPVGVAAKQTQKPFTGSAGTPSGAVAKTTGKPLAGGQTPASGVIRTAGKAISGALAPAAVATRAAAKTVAGVTAPDGATDKATSASYQGSIQSTGLVARFIDKATSGTLTPSGLLDILTAAGGQTFLLALEGAITATSTMAKRASRTFTGDATPTGATIKLAALAFTAATATAGTILRLIGLVRRATITPTGDDTVDILGIDVAGTITPIGDLALTVNGDARLFVSFATIEVDLELAGDIHLTYEPSE